MSKAPPPRARIGFAERLIAARKLAGFQTALEFSRALGIQNARYTRWERAETEPDLTHLQKISALTGVSLDILITGERFGLEARAARSGAARPTLHEGGLKFEPQPEDEFRPKR